MKNIINLHNVKLVIDDNNVLTISKGMKPKNKKDIQTFLFFESITIEKMDISYRLKGFKISYKFVNFISFNVKNFADFEIISIFGIKFVLRGIRQEFQKVLTEFEHIGKIQISKGDSKWNIF